MELGDKATVTVLVFDQPFSHGFFVHGKKTEALPSCRRSISFSFGLVPERKDAQARLILPKTPFTLNTGLAS